MKALSIKQPWAWLIIRPDVTDSAARTKLREDGLIKDIENRDWRYPPTFRGVFLVHASQNFDIEGYEWVKQNLPEIPLPPRKEFDRGGIVGKVRMIDCVSEEDFDEDKEGDPCQSLWFFGPLGFVLEDAEPLPFRPLKGALGFFEVPE